MVSIKYVIELSKEEKEQLMVASAKVYPHNLRHLFARTFYSMEKDIVRLADLFWYKRVRKADLKDEIFFEALFLCTKSKNLSEST